MSNYIELPMVPLRDLIVFPHTILPLLVGRDKSIKAIKEAIDNYDQMIFLVTQKNENEQNPGPDDIYTVGTIAHIVKMIQSGSNATKVIVEGIERARIESYSYSENRGDDFFKVKLSKIELTKGTDDVKKQAYMRSLLSTFNEYAQFKDNIPSEIIMSIKSVTDYSKLIDIIIANIDIKLKSKQYILEIFDPLERMDALLKLIRSEIEILKLEKKISDGVRNRIEVNRKRMFLNEQMEVIKKELGSEDEYNAEITELKKKVKAKKMPKEAELKALDELKKMRYMPQMSSEVSVIRGYIEWLINIPWNESTKEISDLKQAEAILNEDHFGIHDVKERILEFLAVRTLTKNPKGSILCFAGPPGVGKTSLAKSIARATERKYVRMAFGGLKDESEIRGHRRTYVGAMPGGIIQSMKRAGTVNPVFLLDEIDKMGVGYQGDPSSALLEVLDPEQNSSFRDNYLGVDYDLSKTLFIATANDIQNIPYVLRDRLEIIHLSGYTAEEKFEIAKNYLIPKAKDGNGLNPYQVIFKDKSIFSIIHNYTNESGVRSLERIISKIFRKLARKILSNKIKEGSKITISEKDIAQYLGIPKYFHEEKEEISLVGVASGLAWTSVGGDILKIEVICVPGKGNIQITGKLGDVMVESAKAALTYVRYHASKYNLPDGFYEKNDIHIHVPDGAIPKDGPSAGITISTAILSALTNRAVRHDIAMTGEISLRGEVLPIGGLREKLMAAVRSGITTVIIPQKNQKELKEVPKNITSKLKIIPVKQVKEVWDIALES
ncbi:endopeptidase La [bacterium]|nr:endopeptidase La [bacterium]